MKRNDNQDCNILLSTLSKLIDEKLKHLKFNRTQDGIITGTNVNGSYQVKMNDTIYNIYAVDGLVLTTNDAVLVEIINNDFSFKYIKCKRPKVNG